MGIADELTVYIPERAELERMLSAGRSMDERVAYVRSLLPDVRKVKNVVDNLDREVTRLTLAADGMKTELRTLHEKVGGLSNADRAAVEARYEMLSQIKKARGVLGPLRQRVNQEFDVMEEALRPPKT